MDGSGQEDDPDAAWSLPGWTYRDPEFFHAELRRVFRPSWQIAAHESDIPSPGDFHRLDYIGESVIVMRGEDQAIRAFTNVCRHRGARIVDAASGCARKLTCPYHGWTYDSGGRLTGVPMGASYAFDMADHGLATVEVENFHGFLFVRLEDDGGPSVAEMLAPYLSEIAAYRFEELRALGRVTLRPRAVNWKIIGDNYSDGLHIAVAHPGLKRLMGDGYGVEASSYADRMWGPILDRPSSHLSERAYQHFLPRIPHLGDERQRLWAYFKLWPNIAFDIYPDQIDFMQWLPLSPTQTLIREIPYAIPDKRREMRAARYLNWRINRQVNAEDRTLIDRVQAGVAAESFTVGPLSDREVALRHFCKRMRQIIPQARLHRAPAAGWSRAA
ncbi:MULTISPECIES: aromatic ring-hydroxylating oxygenase subunit alpha [unclassified Sphingobium]|uniref:aromatic ring-hydroxylating oxygenase subunit alpha n=1 Tax=unclassified Sphingobium TaxID=2611147 RepID=UPI0007703A45|nr:MULTISPECIES: aromatic ring-hydroxylating dioxygenase subunit alpha [unclassified Sphingobium]AMK24196.1 putative dioxygenase large terminal subunit [Sphingobium sp. TKS]NML91956.1 aromatic ring-hydroxylating dioxygenase subunit alpha [Sphingobium sp. TB-6]